MATAADLRLEAPRSLQSTDAAPRLVHGSSTVRQPVTPLRVSVWTECAVLENAPPRRRWELGAGE
jgi:hypothetical protein